MSTAARASCSGSICCMDTEESFATVVCVADDNVFPDTSTSVSFRNTACCCCRCRVPFRPKKNKTSAYTAAVSVRSRPLGRTKKRSRGMCCRKKQVEQKTIKIRTCTRYEQQQQHNFPQRHDFRLYLKAVVQLHGVHAAVKVLRRNAPTYPQATVHHII